MKLLRDNVPPSWEEMVVSFGSYKGYKHKEINQSYLNWATKEAGNNHSTHQTWRD